MSTAYYRSVEDLPDRLRLSRGVTVVRPQRIIFGNKLVFGMYVPRDEWHPFSDTDRREAQTIGILNEISLVCPAPHLIHDLQAEVSAMVQGQVDDPISLAAGVRLPLPLGQRTLDSALGSQANRTELVSAVFRRFDSAPDSDAVPGMHGNPQGSTTFYPGADKAMGLHVDTWAHRRDDVPEGTPYRCIVNIGQEPRYVVFVNLSQPEISHRIERVYPGTDAVRMLDENPNEWGQHLLASKQAFPVARLTVLPGEAYVMNTHACIHDGWTLHRTAPDVFVILSYIQEPR